jgi:hypothetical protein
MRVVFSLWHRYTTKSWRDVERLLGVYTTKRRAQAAVQRFRNRPGFRRWPNGFEIDVDTLNDTQFELGFITTRPGRKARMPAPKFPPFSAAAAALLLKSSAR